jgi:Nitrate reductase delta subunit
LESGAASCFPTAHYLTGFLNERPLARLRADLGTLGIERAEGQVEPEDHAGVLCEIMTALTGGQFAVAERVQQQFFEKHLAPLDRPLLRRSGAGRGGRFLSPCGNGRPAIHGDRDGSIRAARVSGRAGR